jgi:bifunctional non-homologous end joining protein LigD
MAEHLEGEGQRMFEHACKLELECIVCKRRDSAYRSRRSKAWLKIKNPDSAAMQRLEDGSW